MSNYIFAGKETPELEEYLTNNKALPLVRELNFKYKMQVVCAVEKFVGDQRAGFVMALSDGVMAGIPVGIAYVEPDHEYVDGVRVASDKFAYQSEYISKMRGSSNDDRSTYKSKKLASLLGTIKREDAIPSADQVYRQFAKNINNGIDRALNTLRKGRTSKYVDMTGDQVHTMLKNVINGEPLPLELIDNCKALLDKFDGIDKNVANANVEIERMFGKRFYGLGANKHNDLVVGEFRYTNDRVEILKPIRHIKSFTDVPELIPVITMLKVSLEGKEKEMLHECIPRSTEFHEELDVVTECTHFPSPYSYSWVLTPCGEDAT